MLPLRVRVDLGAISLKGYFVFPKAFALLEPHHQIVLVSYPGHSFRMAGGCLTLCREAFGVFYSPRRLGKNLKEYKVKLATLVEGDPKALFSIATTPRCWGGATPFPGLLYFNLGPYLIMLSAKQGGIKYHFLSLWYDSTWN